MWRRLTCAFGVVALATGVVGSPSASAQQTINFYVGGLVPRSLSSRPAEDVLVRDYYLNKGGFLVFDVGDFKGVTAGGEYLVGLGDFFGAGLGIGIYSRSAPAVDADFTHPNGSDVASTLALRVVPMTATFRYLPLGHHDAIEPYVGAGVGILNWRYTESGDFVDAKNNIVRGSFTGSDTAVGPVILGGVRIPIGSAGIGGEIRYQRATGTLPATQEFAGSTIDLGGVSYLFTASFRF
jgi:hypothetical protein